jgi:protein-tyrosine phosphatase
MPEFIDLHCHWVADIDDGVRTVEEGVDLLQRLRKAGFGTVIATPHMRPGLFDNDRASIQAAYDRMKLALDGTPDLPALDLSSEHYFDDVVFDRLMAGEALPYPGGRAVLVEFHGHNMPARVADRFFDLRRKGLRPVLAHPERYSPVWKRPEMMEDYVDRGTVLLMDVAALAGKYGRATRKCAEQLVDAGLYYAVCSDAHRPNDVSDVAEGIACLRRMVGTEEADFLLIDGPRAVLEGKVDL